MIRAVFAAFVALSLPAWAEIPIQEVTSPGGIKAWLVEDHNIPFTALEIQFKGGTSLEAPDKRGVINLMTATLEEGAGAMDSSNGYGSNMVRSTDGRISTITATASASTRLGSAALGSARVGTSATRRVRSGSTRLRSVSLR